MKIYTISIAIVSLIGGIFWSFNSDFEYEPIILVVTSLVGSIYGIFFYER
jgi:glucose uptake protein GlcU